MGKTKKSYISTDYVNSEVYADNIVSIVFVDEKPETFKSDDNKNMVRYKQNGTVIEQEVKPNLQFYYTVTDAEGNSQTKVSQFVSNKYGNVDEVSSDSGDIKSYEEEITTPSSTWSIQHNLGAPYWKLTINIIDADGNTTEGDIDINSSTNNLLVIKFNEPISGKIYIKK